VVCADEVDSTDSVVCAEVGVVEAGVVAGVDGVVSAALVDGFADCAELVDEVVAAAATDDDDVVVSASSSSELVVVAAAAAPPPVDTAELSFCRANISRSNQLACAKAKNKANTDNNLKCLEYILIIGDL
jgi:hypothetical protein